MASSKIPSNTKPSFASYDDHDVSSFFQNLSLDREVGIAANQPTSSRNIINCVANSSINIVHGVANSSRNIVHGVANSSRNIINGVANSSRNIINGVANSSRNMNGSVANNSVIPSYFTQPHVPNWSVNQGPQVYDHYNLANNSFFNGGSNVYPYLPPYASGSSVGSDNYLNFEPTTIDSGYRYSLMSKLQEQVQRDLVFGNAANGYSHRYNNGHSTCRKPFSNKKFCGTKSNESPLGYQPVKQTNGTMPMENSVISHDDRSEDYTEEFASLINEKDIMSMAVENEGSVLLQRALQGGNLKLRAQILEGVLHHLPRLMSNQYGHHLFRELVNNCTGNEVQQILEELGTDPESLIKAADNIHGSNSIQDLTKRIKKSPFGSYLTAILAPGIVRLATTVTGRHALKQCLSLLSHQANKVLYEEAIKNFDILAVHETGCLALNDCIDHVSRAEQRVEFLHLIVDKTVFLAFDPSGTFIVQHAISLKNPSYSKKICEKLKGHYTQLSTKKFGSHFVEKCIESCAVGMVNAVIEILEKKKALELARNEYGNYVIQKALKTTLVDCVDLCQLLVNALLPNLAELERGRHSNRVVQKIKRIQQSWGKECYPWASKF